MARSRSPQFPVHDHDVLTVLNSIHDLLASVLDQGAFVADTLNDIRDQVNELGVDIDAALNANAELREELTQALANAGVDEAARQEILATLDAHQQKIRDALNPAVPVDPDTPHADHTLPGDLPQE